MTQDRDQCGVDPSEMRFETVSRRAFLKRTAALGAAALVPGALLAACGGDAAAFTATSSATGSTTTSGQTVTTTTAATTTSSADSTSIAATYPAGAEMLVRFTYTASSGGQVRNPYIAVWVEDDGGELVAPIALWFLQSQKGTRWLSELRRWYSVDGSTETVQTVSSATRTPGDYALTWDGTDLDGNLVDQGEYSICIEAAREHGPYSLIRESFTIGDQPFTRDLADNQELTNASVALALA